MFITDLIGLELSTPEWSFYGTRSNCFAGFYHGGKKRSTKTDFEMNVKACKQRNLTISTGEKNVANYELYSADGTNPAPVEVGSLSHHLQGFVHPRWLARRISDF